MKLHKSTFYIALGLIFLILSTIFLPGDFQSTCWARIETPESRQKFILETLGQYSPTGYHIVHTVDSTAAPRGMTWNRYNFAFTDHPGEVDLIEDMVTIVHETNHVYAGRMAYALLKKRNLYGDWYAYYTGYETYSMQAIETFPAREIAPLIPETLRDFRYKTYIDTGSDSQSTQCHGIFGLLDEFNSYYQGAQSAYDLLPWFQGIEKFDWPVTRVYFNMVHADYLAYGEFKLYILSYLLYAKENHPAVYKKIMANQDFRKAFNAIDRNWSKLVADYFDNFDKQLRFCESKGMKTSIFQDDYFFREPDSVYSHGLELLKRRSEYAGFQKEINRPEYQEIKKELEL